MLVLIFIYPFKHFGIRRHFEHLDIQKVLLILGSNIIDVYLRVPLNNSSKFIVPVHQSIMIGICLQADIIASRLSFALEDLIIIWWNEYDRVANVWQHFVDILVVLFVIQVSSIVLIWQLYLRFLWLQGVGSPTLVGLIFVRGFQVNVASWVKSLGLRQCLPIMLQLNNLEHDESNEGFPHLWCK